MLEEALKDLQKTLCRPTELSRIRRSAFCLTYRRGDISIWLEAKNTVSYISIRDDSFFNHAKKGYFFVKHVAAHHSRHFNEFLKDPLLSFGLFADPEDYEYVLLRLKEAPNRDEFVWMFTRLFQVEMKIQKGLFSKNLRELLGLRTSLFTYLPQIYSIGLEHYVGSIELDKIKFSILAAGELV